ncbi:2-polyprenyl-6-methoxyphenol hydroxylase-like FAD-dependent oxidoreductase [Promicromonospora sp. AC04]|uniref:FAD-dependent monooxygenase n=1 Tax=Promicromonospora sp. AC04 TaxID=2135723 RepID=UPI000D39284A|nr:FAD-dependent monooxygenase [Promicromonospora sp. AC04]PUB31913.1 2-polyprenyl-6-methoxyphenol hydroxylase-like FAD-dependent oxidoreductase [Promicromonospora sp. AC04]
MNTPARSTDVAVIGAGPTGLFLAGELAANGVSVTVIERALEPDRLPRANGVVGDAVRLLDERGLYRGLARNDHSLRGMLHRIGTGNFGRHPRPAPVFSYAGFRLPLHRVRRDSPVYVLPVPQRVLELALERRAVEQGAVLRRGQELRSFVQDDDGVHVEIAAPDGADRLSAAYLVGCDGAHSTVRKSAGIDLPGATLDGAVSRLAHVTIPREELTLNGGLRSPDGRALRPFVPHRTARGVLTFGSFGTGLTTMSTLEWGADVPDDDVPLTIEEMRESVGRVVGRPVDLRPPHGPGPHQLRRMSSRNARVAATFRAGRVFLAGDAAHVFTGYGASALNAGLLDAADLAGRLVAAVRGAAGTGTATVGGGAASSGSVGGGSVGCGAAGSGVVGGGAASSGAASSGVVGNGVVSSGTASNGTAGSGVTVDEALDEYDAVRRRQALRTVQHSAIQESLLAPGDEVTAWREEFAARLTDRQFLATLADELAGRPTAPRPASHP